MAGSARGAEASGTAGKARGTETTSDMVRTVFIMLAVLAAVVGLFALTRPDQQLPDAVDYESVVTTVQEEYPYDVQVPASVPESWRATSVHHEQQAAGNRWRVGFLIDGEQFVGLEQTDGDTASYLQERLSGFDPDGSAVTISGDRWQPYLEQDDSPDRALVRDQGGVVTLVRGTAPYDVLEEFVTWLE